VRGSAVDGFVTSIVAGVQLVGVLRLSNPVDRAAAQLFEQCTSGCPRGDSAPLAEPGDRYGGLA